MNLVANRKNLKLHWESLTGTRAPARNRQHERDQAGKRGTYKELVRLLVDTPLERDGFEHCSFAVRRRLEEVDKFLEPYGFGLGVEGIFEWRTGGSIDALNYREEDVIDIQYCNTGDTYRTTILYWNGKFRIGDWGSIVEALQICDTE